jgi:hypothetical protein
MEKNTTSEPRSKGFPQAANHAFSPYSLAFDEFADPRTIPAHWDLSGLLVPSGLSSGISHNQPGESPSTDRSDR